MPAELALGYPGNEDVASASSSAKVVIGSEAALLVGYVEGTARQHCGIDVTSSAQSVLLGGWNVTSAIRG
jgi:hypothetical protein